MKAADFKDLGHDDFTQIRKRLRWTQQQIANHFGYTVGQVSKWERGIHDVPAVVGKSLRCLVPILGVVPAGPPLEAIEENGPVCELEEPNPGNLFALTVRGHSMVSQGILDGDLVIVAAGQGGVGDIVVARAGDEVTVKNYVIEKGKPQLVGDDGPVPLPRGVKPEIIGEGIDLRRPSMKARPRG